MTRTAEKIARSLQAMRVVACRRGRRETRLWEESPYFFLPIARRSRPKPNCLAILDRVLAYVGATIG